MKEVHQEKLELLERQVKKVKEEIKAYVVLLARMEHREDRVNVVSLVLKDCRGWLFFILHII